MMRFIVLCSLGLNLYGETQRWGVLDEGLTVNHEHHATTIEVKREGEESPFFSYSTPEEPGIALEKSFLLGPPTQAEAKGPFLSTIWTKGGRDSRIIITFDLSKAKEGIDSKETIAHTYISAHEIELSRGQLDELRIIGRTDEIDEKTGYYGTETIVCQWRYVPNIDKLLCNKE